MPRIAIAVQDYAAAVERFRTTFEMPVVDLSAMTVPALGAHVGMCVPDGGSNIELMAPATPNAPLAMSLQKFLDRRGEGLYALMLEAPDPNAEAGLVAERGLDVMALMPGASGRDLHPRSTHGVLIRIYPDNSVGELDIERPARPFVSGISTVVVATDDAAKAADVYGHGLGLAIDEPVEDHDRGVLRATATPPSGGRIELVSPIDGTRAYGKRITDRLGTLGQGMFTLTLETDDVAATVETLRQREVTIVDNHQGEFEVFGTRFVLAARR